MPKEKEEAATITFKNDFCSDLSLKNMLYAVTVRSPMDRGIITSITQDGSIEGCTLFTARDVPGTNLVDSAEGKISVFCDGNLSYEGEAIGLLVGPDMGTIEKALNGLRIHYDDIPIEHQVKGSEDSHDVLFTSEERERLIEYGDCFTQESGSCRGIDGALAEAEVTVQNDWTYSLCPRNYRETCGALCSFSGDTLNVYTPSQWISNLRTNLAEVLNIAPEQINVTRTKAFNRSTNSIWYNSIIACQAAVASYRLKAPVKLIYSRQEQESYIDCMKPILFHTELGADREGRLKALKIEATLDCGSTNVFIGEIIDRLAIAASSCYKAENMSVRVKAVPSHTPPLSIDLQLIDSAAFFAMENAMSALVQKLNRQPELSLVFPSDIRKLNLNSQQESSDDEPNEANTGIPFTFMLPKAEESIDILFNSSDFKNKYIFYNRESLMRSKNFASQFTASPFVPPVRGIGFAAGYEGSFYYGSTIYGANQELEVTLEEDGDLVIHSPPLSKSIQEIWTKLASDILDIRPSRIKMGTTFEGGSEPYLPESAYANISITTVLLKKCCEAIRRKREKSGLPISVTHKLGSVQKKAWDSQQFRGKPFHSCSFAAATVEVELDCCTFTDRIRKIQLIISGGQILSSPAAEATIKLGIQKILSSLTDEKETLCDDISISFMKDDGNPEQIGGLVYQIIPSAYLQALSQALGTQLTELPLQYDSIYRKIQELQARAAVRSSARHSGSQSDAAEPEAATDTADTATGEADRESPAEAGSSAPLTAETAETADREPASDGQQEEKDADSGNAQ